jgi:hypothetical protein
LNTPADGALLVAITDANLSYETKKGKSKELHLSKGDVQWCDGAGPKLKNTDRDPARFAVLEMR